VAAPVGFFDPGVTVKNDLFATAEFSNLTDENLESRGGAFFSQLNLE
jgi:hypothetical protein